MRAAARTRCPRASIILPTHVLTTHKLFGRYVISNGGKTTTKGPIRDKKPLWYQQGCLFDEVIFSQDYHPAGHISFGSKSAERRPISHVFSTQNS